MWYNAYSKMKLEGYTLQKIEIPGKTEHYLLA